LIVGLKPEMKNQKIIVSGAGLAGSLLAACLAKKGFKVEVFERRADMRKGPVEAGRSINLALSSRGINALKKVGMDAEVLKDAIPMYGRMIHDIKGETFLQPYGTKGQYINSVSRSGLNLKLIDLLDSYPNATVHFNSPTVNVDFDKTSLIVSNNGNSVEHTGDAIIASDGAFSPVRSKMQKTTRFNYSQEYENYGYKELEIKPNEDGGFKIDKNALHIWPRGDFMMIALPNPNGSFTCTLFLPYEGEKSFENLQTENQVNQFFQNWFPDAKALMPDLTEMFFSNPIGALVTVRCNPWVRGKVALLGDAAHAIVPFYGQGMNAAFEDVAVLDELIADLDVDWDNVFDLYQQERIHNANAIADLALQNFVEMRDLVGRDDFILFKKVENRLCELYPDRFKSQYELVTFSNVPYSFAQKAGSKNAALIHFIIEHHLQNNLEDSVKMNELFDKFEINF
jgi:kynurenine 3-monooxygenase